MQSAGTEKKNRFRNKLIFVILALIVLLALVLFNKLYLNKPSRFSRGDIELDGPYKVRKVVDGDTFYIKKDGKDVKVRLIGVDAPESVAPSASGKENTKEGEKAAKYLKNLIDGKNIYLEYDLDNYDQYGRLLAYVYKSDQETMVQRVLLSEGYAMVVTYQPNVKYADEFVDLQRKARSSGKGFWGTGYY
jgi:micrococcal nuclease